MVKTVKIFGILNFTPDSFSDGGKFFSKKKALEQAEKLFSGGANFLDVGAESTRPGATEISADAEFARLEKILPILIKKFGGEKISLDTKNFSTAQKFLNLGGKILNDVSGFSHPKMAEIAPQFSRVILNHFPGKNLREVHEKKIDSIAQIRDELLQKKNFLVRAGVAPKKIILDPGIGFGKTAATNFALLRFAEILPREKILLGFSRKRFLGRDRFSREKNAAAAKIAVDSGADFLRLHEIFPIKF